MQEQIEKRQSKGFVTESNLTINSNNLLSGQNQISVECQAKNTLGASPTKQHIIRVLCKFQKHCKFFKMGKIKMFFF